MDEVCIQYKTFFVLGHKLTVFNGDIKIMKKKGMAVTPFPIILEF
jgi:hypothetical protein